MPSTDIVITTALVGSVLTAPEGLTDVVIGTPLHGTVLEATNLALVSIPLPSPTLFPSPDLFLGPVERWSATIGGPSATAVITTPGPN